MESTDKGVKQSKPIRTYGSKGRRMLAREEVPQFESKKEEEEEEGVTIVDVTASGSTSSTSPTRKQLSVNANDLPGPTPSSKHKRGPSTSSTTGHSHSRTSSITSLGSPLSSSRPTKQGPLLSGSKRALASLSLAKLRQQAAEAESQTERANEAPQQSAKGIEASQPAIALGVSEAAPPALTSSPGIRARESVDQDVEMTESVSMQGDRSDAQKSPSAKQTRPRRDEEQRRQDLLDDPTCGEVEPTRAYCKLCDRWLSLGYKTTYGWYQWGKHRQRHEKSAPNSPLPNASHLSGSGGLSKAAQTDAGDSDGDTASIAPSIASTAASVRMSEAQRKAFLEDHPSIQEVQPYSVQCKRCSIWISLGKKTTYRVRPWTEHNLRCTGAIQSSRVAMAQRKIALVNDPLARKFTTNTVKCAQCNAVVQLGGEGRYELKVWNEHKEKCQSPFGTPVGAPPSRPAISPRKRPRDEAEVIESTSVDKRNVRARTEVYIPPEGDAPPSVWGWLLTPWKIFMRGFREGYNSTSAT